MIILFANISLAQNSNYEDLWKTVEQFESKGLPKSALEIVDNIRTKAAKDENHPQLIKTMIFKSKFALAFRGRCSINYY